MLAQNHDVTLVGRDGHVRAVNKRGLRLSGDVSLTAKVKATMSPSGIHSPDLLLVSTKAYDTESAIEACRKHVGPDTVVLTLQNGLGNLELLRAWKGQLAFGGTTTMGAALVSPGIVRVSGLGQTVIGADGQNDIAGKIADSFR